MIEIRQIEGLNSSVEYELFIDGSRVEGAKITHYTYQSRVKEYNVYSVRTVTRQATELITDSTMIELVNTEIFNLRLRYEQDWLEALSHISIDGDDEEETYSILFSFKKLSRWRRKYSFADYYIVLCRLFRDSGIQNVRVPSGDDLEKSIAAEHFTLEFTSIDGKLPIAEELARCSDVLLDFHEQAEKELESRLYSDSVVVSFEFPEEVRVPCEQYLLYFAQFLRDLGVNVDTALTHEAGQVLFTVTPEDEKQALDKIRAALGLYLHLPSSPASDAGGKEIAILRLNSELQSLHSKLSLATAEIQMKDAAIQLQKVTIAQLTGEVIVESLKDVTPKPKDKEKEELLGDIVSLVPIKGKGFEVNLPELFRRLKQLFKDKDEH